MRLCSVITAHYTGPAGLSGTLSVVGPTRMHYSRTIALVDGTTQAVSRVLRDAN